MAKCSLLFVNDVLMKHAQAVITKVNRKSGAENGRLRLCQKFKVYKAMKYQSSLLLA